MNQLQVFKNDLFEVAVKLENREWVYDAERVAKSLGFTDNKGGREYIRWNRVNEYLKAFATSGEIKKGDFIPESAVYKLAFKASNEVAEKFQNWLAIEVLPTIRKHGAYMTENTIEKALTSPDFLIQLATKLKEEKQARLKAEQQNVTLETENKLLAQEDVEWADRKIIEALIKTYGCKIGFENAWREFKKELLYMHGININARITNHMNNTGKKTKPKTLSMIQDDELSACISTAVAICRNNDVNIDRIISKHREIN